jgi:hypothetical protein
VNKKKTTLSRPRKKSAGQGVSQKTPDTAKPAVDQSQPEQLDNHHGPMPWKPWLDSYQDLRALQFHTPGDFAAAAKLLWNDQLRDLPYDLVGSRTIIIPAEAVPFFHGLEVTETDVLHPGDIPPQELADLRKEQGPY